ncbi:1-propanol dehydrogenase PduQ [Neobacillus sp. Marseille-QA0830]
MNTLLLKPKVYYGNHSLESLQDLHVERALIITDQMMVKLGTAEKITKLLPDASCTIFSEVEPNPSLETVKAGLSAFLTVQPDLLVALGGGSPIDTAKAILLFAQQVNNKAGGALNVKRPLFVAIPTTSGTGSEVTSYAVVTDTARNVKIPLSDDSMYPDIAILDEQLTKSVPPSVTADTGMDVLTHAIEAYVSLQATDFTNIFAERAIKDVFTYLLRAYRFGEDLEARGKLHLASCMAGAAFTNATLGINHSLAHAVGAKFHLSHGKSNAILLPYVIQYNGGLCDGTVQTSEAARRYTEISQMLGLASSTLEEGVLSLSTAVHYLNRRLGIPQTFKDGKIEEDTYQNWIPTLAEDALKDICTAGNPKRVTKEDLEYLLKWAYQA